MAFFKKKRTSAEADSTNMQEQKPAEEIEEVVFQDDHTASNSEEEEETEWMPPQTRLVFPDHMGNELGDQRYVLQFAHSELPQIPEGHLAINGFKIQQTSFAFEVTAFLRNLTGEMIALEELPLILLDANQNAVARRVFDLEGLELEDKTAIPYTFEFLYENLISVNSLDFSSWFVGFHMQNGELRAATPLEPFETNRDYNWAGHIDAEDQQVYEQFQRILEETENQVNFIATRVHVSQEDELSVEIMLRNGTDEGVSFSDNMTYTLRDSEGDVIASQTFDLSGIHVDPHTVALSTLTFNDTNWIKREANLENWTLEVE